MKELFRKYSAVLRFILLFLGTYMVLSLIYGGFLQLSKSGNYHPDYITHLVANQSELLINEMGYTSNVLPNPDYPSMQLFINGVAVGQIIEGCNAISIIILFIAFIVAFAQDWKKTILFLFGGAVLIYAINIIRIAILAIALYQFPRYQEILHTVVFPGIIYGMVFLLWVVWVKSLPKNGGDE
jgi:exosortase family protein XrtF